MRKTLTLALALATLATSGIALAQDNQQPERRSSHAMSMTRDQVVQMADRAFEQMDANRDGVLDQADRAADQKAVFDRLDGDHNGAISFAEFQSARSQRREAREERAGPGAPPPAGPGAGQRSGFAGPGRGPRLRRTPGGRGCLSAERTPTATAR